MRVSWLAGILCVSSAAAATAPPAARPAHLAERPVRLAAWLAPQGATPLGWSPRGALLVAMRGADTTQLFLVAAAGVTPQPLTRFDDPVDRGAISPDPARPELIFAKRRGGRANARLYLETLGGARTRPVTTAAAGAHAPLWSNAGHSLAFARAAAAAEGDEIDVIASAAPASPRVIVTGDGGYPVPLDWSPGDRRLLVRETLADGGVQLYTIDLADGERRPVGPADGADAIPQARFARDRDGIYLITSRGAQFRELRFIDSSTGRETRVSRAGGDVGDFALSRDGRFLAYTQDEAGTDRLDVVDLRAQRELSPPPLPEPGLIGSLHFDGSGSRLAFAYQAPDRPREAYVLDLARDKLAAWTHGGSMPTRIVAPRLLHFPTFDRVGAARRRLPIYLYEPTGIGRHPVLILFHSGANGRFRPGFNPWIQYVVDRLGTAVIAPNLRGSSGQGKDFEALGDGRLRGDVMKDIGALLVWLEARPDLDPRQVVVAGRGYGGYLALMAAVYYSPRLRGVVDVGGITDLPSYLDALPPRLRPLMRRAFGDERDPDTRVFLRLLSPLALADRITVPVLIVHGRNDPRVPLAQAQEFASLLRVHHDRVRMLIAKDEGHRFERWTDRAAFYAAFARFLQRARRAGAPTCCPVSPSPAPSAGTRTSGRRSARPPRSAATPPCPS